MGVDERMLKELGVQSVDELFSDVPEAVRTGSIALPDGMSEMEVVRTVRSMLSQNVAATDHPCFLGAGIYHRFVPAAVTAIVSRSELQTSYTPYQAEISQGMLQSLFEYQSYVAELTGMEAVNSSNYDSYTALGEAASMCSRINEKSKFLVPEAMGAGKRSVLHNYVRGLGMQVVEYGFDPLTGEMDLADLGAKVDGDVSGIYVEVPNFLGIIDRQVTRVKKEFPDPALVVGADPISLGVLKAPADYGADIVIGEGQSLGSPMNFGGPLLGLFGCRQEHVRKMPGRVIGMTRDLSGRRAFSMTLQTREQHIRRERATSNICTNEALMAVAASVYLAIVGRSGLRALAMMNMERAKATMDALCSIKGIECPALRSHHFNEFTVRTPIKPEKLSKVLMRKGIIGGLPLARHVPSMGDCMLLAATEMTTDEDIGRLVAALEEVA
ncbi:MAG: aminomethyl-transferring glycine dehydrogenase subunit GcvPA [Methanomassiliicoccus sp.]|nr:aminomethyl-transferring glycine dehydrogenase subunit GcvPA [Methanomassiliicoccus sp.]